MDVRALDAEKRLRFSSRLDDETVALLTIRARQICALHETKRRRSTPSFASSEPRDLVHQAILVVLLDIGRWREDVPFEAFMTMLMRNLAGHDARAWVPRRTRSLKDDDLERPAHESDPAADAELLRVALDVALSVVREAEGRAYLVCLFEKTTKRSEIASALRWPLYRLDRVRARVRSMLSKHPLTRSYFGSACTSRSLQRNAALQDHRKG